MNIKVVLGLRILCLRLQILEPQNLKPRVIMKQREYGISRNLCYVPSALIISL